MDYSICKATYTMDVHETFREYRSESSGVKRVLAILAGLLLAAIPVLAHESPGLSAKAQPPVAKTEGRSTDSKVAEMERAVLLLTNKERSSAGLASFEPSAALNYLAQGQSKNMCKKKELQHESDAFPRGWKKFRDRLKMVGLRSGGENVAYLTTSPEIEKWAKQVVNGWMKSPPHKKNILNAKFLYLGVGVAMCTDNLAYVTQVFSPDIGRLP